MTTFIKYLCPICEEIIVNDEMAIGSNIKKGEKILGGVCNFCEHKIGTRMMEVKILAVWHDGEPEPFVRIKKPFIFR